MGRVNYRNYIARIAARVLRGGPGERFAGAVALLFDWLSEGGRQAVRAFWIADRPGNGPAYDALGPAGQELSLPRYPGETWGQYHARLARAWDDWPLAGDETSILGQLAAAGFPGAVIYYPPDAPAYLTTWSQFAVFFARGLHPVTGPGAPWGSFKWGDGTTYGPTGITAGQLQTIRSIIRKFKPAHWICPAIVFEVTGWTYGTSHKWGEPGLVYGGLTIQVPA
jgi:hypothetical protein